MQTGKKQNKFLGFTLAEVLVAITIIGVMAATISLSANSLKTTAKHEAEKVAQFLRTQINNADKMHRGVYFGINSNKITALNQPNSNVKELASINASSGCAYTPTKDINYNTGQQSDRSKAIKGRYVLINVQETGSKIFEIKVTGKGDAHYVVISVSGDTTIK